MPLAYLFSRYPVVSQTFCDSEMLALEAAGRELVIGSLNRPPTSFRHERLRHLRAEVVYPPPSAVLKAVAMPEGSPCRSESPSFLGLVEAAQAEVLRTRPDLFDGPRVRSEDAYVQEVARVLRTRGLCASQGGPKDEVAVKNTNDWNDQYDIVLGTGEPWTSYQVTCRPARF